MRKLFEVLKKYWKKTVSAIIIFLVVFAILFYLANLNLKPSPQKTFTTEESFAGKLGDEFKKRVGASDVYELGYNEWAAYYGLVDSNKRYDDDPDGDGLPNYLEYVHSTDPKNPDTDGDGFSDRQEITNGYDPDAPGDAKPSVEIAVKKINVASPMIWSKSEDEKSLLEDLKNGIIHFPKTAAPGQNGNMVVSGHSSNYVWAAGNFNYVFRDLNSLAAGDIVDVKTVQKNGRVIVYHYKINGFKKIVSPDDPVIFENTPEPSLTLSTCWPLGTNFRRLIVKADLVK